MSPRKQLKVGTPKKESQSPWSRCFNGIAEPVYAYQGGGAVATAGIFFVKELKAQKARLKLYCP